MDVGDIAPEFSLVGKDDMIHTLVEFRGSRAIVVLFISEGCSFDGLRSLKEKYHPRGVSFVAINSFDRELRRPLPWTYLHDPSGEIAKRYEVDDLPHAFLFDQKRHLIYTGNLEHLSQAIDEHLDSRPISKPRTLLAAAIS